MLRTMLKSAAIVGFVGLTALAVSTSGASARTYTRCDADGDNCVRVHCDWTGNSCWSEDASYLDRDRYYDENGYYGGYADRDRHWVCDADGDDCHWVYDPY